MALDRQSIEKRDFPIARRGYDPEAVDAHLASLADEIDSMRRGRSGGGAGSLAAAASEQVRLIVEAAEQSATEIEREAEYEASQIRQDAREDADRMQAEAEAKASGRVAAVSTATGSLLQRIEGMEGQLGELFESLRSGAQRLAGELETLQGEFGELRTATDSTSGAASSRPLVSALEDEAAAAGAPAEAVPVEEPPLEAELEVAAVEAVSEPQMATGAFGVPAPTEPEPAAEAEPEQAAEPAAPSRRRRRERAAAKQAAAEAAPEPAAEPQPAASGGADEEGARLIALNMALNGTPREETERYLADNFNLTDSTELLDDVYQRAGQ